LKSISDDTQESHVSDVTGDSERGGLRARLERYERNAGGGIQILGNGADPGSSTELASPTVTDVDEPITPELALVDPELARRARARLPEHRFYIPVPLKVEAVPGPAPKAEAVPEPATLDDARRPPEPRPRPQGGRGSRKRRTATYALVLVILGATAAAITYARPFDRFSSQSGNGSAAPSSDNTSRANARTPRDRFNQSREPATQRAKPPGPVTSPRSFAWAPVSGAASYLVQFYRARTEIFRARPSKPRVVVPAHWSFKGHAYSLEPGRYRWSVRPRLGRGARRTYGQPVVLSQLVVQRSSNGGGQSTRSP
jgi:hypothetical protein